MLWMWETETYPSKPSTLHLRAVEAVSSLPGSHRSTTSELWRSFHSTIYL